MSLTLEAKKRDTKLSTKSVLAWKSIPCVVYGPSLTAEPISVDYYEFKKVFGEAWYSKLIKLKLGSREIDVLIKSYDTDKVKNTYIHVDFLAVSRDHKVVTEIPISFEWVSPVAKLWWIISRRLSTIKVQALPYDLPESFKVNLEKLATFESRLVVGDLDGTENIRLLIDSWQIVASVIVPRSVAASASTEWAEWWKK